MTTYYYAFSLISLIDKPLRLWRNNINSNSNPSILGDWLQCLNFWAIRFRPCTTVDRWYWLPWHFRGPRSFCCLIELAMWVTCCVATISLIGDHEVMVFDKRQQHIYYWKSPKPRVQQRYVDPRRIGVVVLIGSARRNNLADFLFDVFGQKHLHGSFWTQ